MGGLSSRLRRRDFARTLLGTSLLPKIGGLAAIASDHSPPAFPHAVFRDSSLWDGPDFVLPLVPRISPSERVHRRWPVPIEIFGLRPHSLSARFEGDPVQSITVLFLDSGTHFGYVPRSEAHETEEKHRQSFRALEGTTAATVKAALEQLSGSAGRECILGGQPMLELKVTLYRCGDVTARLHHLEEQLVKVTFFRDPAAATRWIDPAIVETSPEERRARFADQVHEIPDTGDILLGDLPLLPQGDRAYCGVSALAMTMQRLDLLIDTEDYAAAAGIRYGSTQGSYIREVYGAAAREAGFRLRRSDRFDFAQVRDSIRAGLPVIVWRRWSQERDYLHSQFARKFARDPSAELPEPDSVDRSTWPARESYTHASVVNGINEARGEVIFSESWNESARNRRMRQEEMAGTAYQTFLLQLPPEAS